MAQKNVVITQKARRDMARARAGDQTLPKIVGMAFGDGGVNSSGTVLAPSESQTALRHELMRKAMSSKEYTSETTCRYVCTLKEAELAGKSISEIGLYDSSGAIAVIKTFAAKGKDDDVEMTFTLDDAF